MSDLPKQWAVAEIGELCSLNNGRPFKQTDWGADGLPIVRIQNLNNPLAKFNYFAGDFEERYVLRGGELLFAWSGTPGTSFGAHIWRGGAAVLNQHIFRVDFPAHLIDKRFFRHAINQKLGELIDTAHGGVGLRHVTKGAFERTTVAVPPLDEQKRIADKLDALLAQVNACRERVERLPKLLKRFRQSILSAAVSGTLTEDWREKRETHSSAWVETSVGEVITAIEAGVNVKCRERPPEEHEKGLVKISAVTWGEYNDNESKTLPVNREIPENTRIRIGDFLISRANTIEFVGACVIVKETRRPVFLSDKILRLVMPESRKAWMLFFLRSPQGRKQIEALASGNQLSMRNLSQANLRDIRLPIPPDDELGEIRRRAEALLEFVKRAGESQIKCFRRVNDIAPALLAKAFRGELVPQDPNDEPADLLLDRIRDSRELSAQVPRTHRVSTPASPPTIKKEIIMLNRKDIESKHLARILKSTGPLTAEALWAASKLEIDDFYDVLREEESGGLLREVRSEDPNIPRMLEAA